MTKEELLMNLERVKRHLPFDVYAEMGSLINRPKVTREFIDKWALRLEVAPLADEISGDAPFDTIAKRFLIPMLRELGHKVEDTTATDCNMAIQANAGKTEDAKIGDYDMCPTCGTVLGYREDSATLTLGEEEKP